MACLLLARIETDINLETGDEKAAYSIPCRSNKVGL